MVTSFRQIVEKNSPFFSFEYFPPKKEEDLPGTKELMLRLSKLEPAFMTVTYGAAGGSRELTSELTAFIREKVGCPAVAHLTCVGHSVEEIDGILDKLQSLNVEHILALRGDKPDEDLPTAFSCARDLVKHINSRGGFSVAVAGYPETHPDASSQEEELGYLNSKLEAGSDLIITQLFFDSAMYFNFVSKLRAKGITAPVLPGVLPIRSVKQVERFTKLCGASIPSALASELEKYREDAAACREFGCEVAYKLSKELLDGGAPGIHYYTLNKSLQVETVIGRLRQDGWFS